MKGTRRGVLKQLEDWLHDEQGERFLWLSGGAGTGKSAIAQTFAEMCFADGILGASFFRSRAPYASDIQFILPTLAFQLANRYPRFREETLEILRENPDIVQEGFDGQLEKLMVGPFEATQIQTLIIIDGLEDCDYQGLCLPAGTFISALCKHMDGIPNVKFLIAGRPLLDSGCRRLPLNSKNPLAHATTKKVDLDEVERSSVDDDIKLFMRAQLGEYKKVMGHQHPEDWPDSHYVDDLCSQAGGRFAAASVLTKRVFSEGVVQELKAAHQDLLEVARNRADRLRRSKSRHTGTR